MRAIVMLIAAAAAVGSLPATAQDVPAPAAVVDRATSTLVLAQGPRGHNVVWPDMAPPFIEFASQISLTTGAVEIGKPFVVMSYRYLHPVRLENDVKTIFHTLPAGTLGFDVGDYTGPRGTQHVTCFFREGASKQYGLPECLLSNGPGGSWMLGQNYSNVPTYLRAVSPIFGVPSVATDGVVIDHAFSYQLVVRKWSEKDVSIVWLSDGEMTSGVLGGWKPSAEGTIGIDIDAGTISLRRDPSDKKKVIVSFIPRT